MAVVVTAAFPVQAYRQTDDGLLILGTGELLEAEPPSGFPDATNTGYDEGSSLTTITGNYSMSVAGATLDSRHITGSLVISAPNITVTNCLIDAVVQLSNAANSVTIEDSTIIGGNNSQGALARHNITARRCDIRGGQHSVLAETSILLEDCWLHAQYDGSSMGWHQNGFISNGGNGYVIRHCTLHGEPPNSVSSNLSLFPDFYPVYDVLVEDCLFKANLGAFGTYGGYDTVKTYGNHALNATDIRYLNNIFEISESGSTGTLGTVATWGFGRSGNVWSGNTWDDGSPFPIPNV